MTDDQPLEPRLAELELRLRELDVELLFPLTPSLADTVSARLGDAETAASIVRLPQRRVRTRWWLTAAAALCLALLSAFAFPQTRTTVAGWFGLEGVRFISADQVTTTPVGRSLALGGPTTLTDARSQLSFTPLVPTLEGFEEPDDVYVDARPVGGMLALVYAERDGLLAGEVAGVGLLLTQFRGDLNPDFVSKGLPDDTIIESVEVADQPGVWVSGDVHLFFYTDPTGAVLNEELRLAGNTLLWQAGELTLRLEGPLALDEMLRIAESLAPSP